MSSHPLESLSALLDDELGDAERRVVEAHLAACSSCARHLRELAAVDELARGLPPADAPDGYLEALPGRVRQRIRADRPAASRPTWVWPLAAGLALAVLAPLVLRQNLSRARVSSSSPAVVMEAPAAPGTTVAPEPSRMAKLEDTLTRPPAASRAPQREAAPAPKARGAFAPPPPSARANESFLGEQAASVAVAKGAAGAAPAAAPPAEQEALAAADHGKEEPTESADAARERMDAPTSLKKADALRRSAPPPQEERGRIDSGVERKTFRDNASLPGATPEEARRAREAWRRFVSLHPAGPRADEGRVRFIEAAVTVFRLTRDEGDRTIAEREGRAYLATPGAPQASRVRAALSHLDDSR